MTNSHGRGSGFPKLGSTTKEAGLRRRRQLSGVRRSLLPAGARLLLVLDDDAALQRTLVSVLSVAYQVIDAPDMATALAIAVRFRPAAVVTAQDTPMVTGGRLAELLALALGPLAPPIVLVTGRHPRHVRDAVVDAVVIKPFVPDQLLRAVSRLLQQRAEARRGGAVRVG